MSTTSTPERRPLYFKKVTVRRMPGIPDPGFTVDKLNPGLTVIKGPNASGKTTLAKAMESLIWPSSSTKGAAVEGEMSIADEGWVMETVDRNPGRCQCNGSDSSRPDFPGADWARRYRLSLEDLAEVQDHNLSFAALIARETAGGLDLSRLTKSVKDAWKPRGPKATAKELAGATQALRGATDEQRKGSVDEASLGTLRKREEAARHAQAEARRWESALNVLQTGETLRLTEAELKSFPDGMERLSGHEWKRLTELEEEAGHLAETLEDIQARQNHTRRDLLALALPATGLSEELLAQWRSQVARLQEHLRECDRRVVSLRQITEQERLARERLGSGSSPPKIQLSEEALTRLEDYGHRAEALLARKAQLATEQERLQADLDGQPPREDGLEEGMSAAARWLEERSSSGPHPPMTVYWILCCLVALGAGVLAWQVHAGWLGLLLPGILALALVRRTGKTRRDGGTQGMLQDEILRLGIGSPPAWTAAAVAGWMRELAARSAAQRALEVLEHRMADLESRRRLEEKAWTDLRAHRAQLVAELGIAPHLRDETPDRVLAPWFAAVSQWSRSAHALEGESAALQSVEGLLEQGLRGLARQMTEAGVNSPVINGGPLETKVLAIDAHVQALDDRRRRYETFTAALSRLEVDRSTTQTAQERNEKARRDLFQTLGMEDGATGELQSRIDLLDSYRSKCQDRQSASGAHRESMARSREAGGHEEDWAKSREELELLARQARDRFGELSAILEQISAIRTRVESMKAGHQLTQALARRDRCLDKLQDLQQAEMRWVTSGILLEGMKEHLRQVGRPAVFVRSAEILSAITAGRCILDMDDDASKPAFRVREAGDSFYKPLDQLSSATRLQVLLAVRLAFVECQETSFKLPVILDETLANSDDVRSAALARSVLRLAQDGRQILYLTAQQDEVDKWQQAAQTIGLPPPPVIDLATLRP